MAMERTSEQTKIEGTKLGVWGFTAYGAFEGSNTSSLLFRANAKWLRFQRVWRSDTLFGDVNRNILISWRNYVE